MSETNEDVDVYVDGDVDVDDHEYDDEVEYDEDDEEVDEEKNENNLNKNNDDDDDDDDYDDYSLKKFSTDVKNDHIKENHPEIFSVNYENVNLYTNIVRDEDNNINDKHHKTLPFLTKYEKTRILGLRAKQIECGSTPFVDVENGLFDGYLIAMKELEEKKIPFIVKRPIPDGTFEYWKVSDLEILV